jgi:hypothetical protein
MTDLKKHAEWRTGRRLHENTDPFRRMYGIPKSPR